jgi:hypothetical protein
VRVVVAPSERFPVLQTETGELHEVGDKLTAVYPKCPEILRMNYVPAVGSIVADCWNVEYKVTRVDINTDGTATLLVSRDNISYAKPDIQLRLIRGQMLGYQQPGFIDVT